MNKQRSQQLQKQGHPVLTRMMKSLQLQKVKQVLSSSERAFVSKTSFASSNNKVFGRNHELQQLLATYQRVSSSGTKSEIALVHGKSGVGKSSLVNAFFKELSPKAFFVSGKFDQLKSHVPYDALIRSCNSLAQQALKRTESEVIRARLQAEMGPDTSLLGTLLKEASRLLDNQRADVSMSGQAFTRFKLLIRSFFRSIATAESPVVLFMDDLQWADEATVEVLEGLVSDTLSKHLLLLVAYRDDEIEDKILTTLLSDAPDSTNISVSNLDFGPLNQMVASALQMGHETTKSLTNVIMHKTQGNPFYALNFLDMLYTREILQQGEEDTEKRWEWDVDTILQLTNVTDNLATILESKILRLPERVRSILQLASFIGFDFSTDVLTTIVDEEQDMIEGEYSFELVARKVVEQWIAHALDVALKEGLIELTTADKNSYKFSHDKIQQCLYRDLMPDDVERRLLHQRIGKLLWNTIKGKEVSKVDDWILFLAADNLNRGPKFVDDNGDCREMIELNLRAGKLAAKKAAFCVAVEYIRAGQKLIKDDDAFVENNYELCMDLFGAGADTERAVGCYDHSNGYVRKIHKHARTIEDRFVAYISEIKSLAIGGDPGSAISLSLKVLRLLGERFPKKITILTILREFIRARSLIGKRDAKDLLDLPKMTDTKKLNALELLCSIAGYAYIAGESANHIHIAVLLRAACVTLRHGLSECNSAIAFVGYGIILSILGNYKEGSSYGDLAMELVQKFNAEQVVGRVQIARLSMVYIWKHGLCNGLVEMFMEGYHNAMLHGDVDYAHWGSMGWIISGMNAGVYLPKVVNQARSFCTEMKEYGTCIHMKMNLPMWQIALNMVGDNLNPHPAILSGEALDLDEFKRGIMESKSVLLQMHVASTELAVSQYFQDWDRVRGSMQFAGRHFKVIQDYWSGPLTIGRLAWCAFVLYDRTGKRKYKRICHKMVRFVNKCAARGSPLGLLAEKQMTLGTLLYLKKETTPSKAERHFLATFSAFKENRIFWVLSYMTESLANSFIEARDYQKGKHYLQMAAQITRQWGAHAKSQQLEHQISAVDMECCARLQG